MSQNGVSHVILDERQHFRLDCHDLVLLVRTPRPREARSRSGRNSSQDFRLGDYYPNLYDVDGDKFWVGVSVVERMVQAIWFASDASTFAPHITIDASGDARAPT
jgi:hypothetical protein